jgi:bacteriorhodopsin
MTLSVYKSLLLSISTQIVTGIIEVIALLVKVPSKFLFLKQMLVLEVIVQFIEGSFYVYWFRNFKKIVNITPQRYLDWVVTTPTMLITLMFYLIYLKHKQDNTSNQLQFFDLFKKEFNTIITVLSLNWLMLLFGYLGEVKLIPVLLGVALGFIPFFIYYYIIYKKYALLSDEGLKIFYYFLIVWSAYGIVATLSYKIKNTLYNILDLFSKNFFGIFLTYLLFTNIKS